MTAVLTWGAACALLFASLVFNAASASPRFSRDARARFTFAALLANVAAVGFLIAAWATS